MAWHTTCIYYSAILDFSEPYHHHKVKNNSIIFKLMHHLYLQHAPTYKHFDPWEVEWLLSLLES